MKVAEVTFEEALRQARFHHHEGNLIVAECMCERATERDPRNKAERETSNYGRATLC